MKTSATMSANIQEISKKNGLVLYFHPYSYYSHKVLMALHEKHLQFDSIIINLVNETQYEPWFLKINPRGEVPVLQDTGKVIPDSTRIIDYLEDNFSNGLA
uniref:GST N-terminal domain-containing protein n=1 Tax=Photinus pyralis TaxID=7054 RepID=A0A1Y1NNY4_PHOPY